MAKLFNLEEFGLFLATNLMGGPHNMKAKFETSATGTSFPFYWRSCLLADIELPCTPDEPPSSTALEIEQGQKFEVIFVDVSVSFRVSLQDNKGAKLPISIAFGALLRRPNSNDFFYLKGPSVTTKFLRDHVDQHDVVLEETKSHVIAKQMAQALLNLQPGSLMANVTLEGEGHNCRQVAKADIPLSYEDGTEMSNLTIVNNTGPAQKLDPNVASTWLCSILSKEDDKDLPEEEGSKSHFVDAKESPDLLAMFQEWKEATIECLRAEAKAKTKPVSNSNNVTDNDGTAASSPSGLNTSTKRSPASKEKIPQSDSKGDKDSKDKVKTKPKRPKIHHGMARLGAPAKKRKKTGGNPFGPAKR